MNTILLTNLIKIRWIAIFGQLSAIFFVNYVLEIQLLFFECILVIMLSVIINLGAYFFQKKLKISDEIVFLFLLFDNSLPFCNPARNACAYSELSPVNDKTTPTFLIE